MKQRPRKNPKRPSCCPAFQPCLLITAILLIACTYGPTDTIFEPNNSRYQALVIDPAFSLADQPARLLPGDQDWFKIVVPAGSTLYVTMPFIGEAGIIGHIYADRILVDTVDLSKSTAAIPNESGLDGTYYIQVVGKTPETEGEYTIDIHL